MNEGEPAGNSAGAGHRAVTDRHVVEELPAEAQRRRVEVGPITVEVADERVATSEGTTLDAVAGCLDLNRWGCLAAAAARSEGVEEPAEMGLMFVDEAAIATLAERWMQSTHPTDVLAFPVDGLGPRAAPAGDAGPPLLIGDVVVCPSVAARQAAEAGRHLDDELALLVVHGVLHLLGHDHERRAEARRMERRTRAVLGQHHHP